MPRISLPQAPEKYDRANEQQTRRAIETAFEKLPAPSTGGGGGGGGADADGYFLVDRASHAPAHAFVIPRALGPDRVPASPNAMDDEMLDATTGFDSGLWTQFSTGAETYDFDALGGLRVGTVNDSTVRGIEQAFSDAGAWSFQTKVCLGLPLAATNGHAGLMVRDVSNQHMRLFVLSQVSGQQQLNVYEFNDTTTFSDNLISSNLVDHIPTDWVYLRMRGGPGASPCISEYSLNGVAWRVLLNSPSFPNNIDTIGLITMQFDSNVGNAYFQHFRRLV